VVAAVVAGGTVVGATVGAVLAGAVGVVTDAGGTIVVVVVVVVVVVLVVVVVEHVVDVVDQAAAGLASARMPSTAVNTPVRTRRMPNLRSSLWRDLFLSL
jgi:hypothetical protein